MRISKPFPQSADGRLVLLGVIVACLALAVGGCGGSDKQPAAPSGSPDTAAQAPDEGAKPAKPPEGAAPAEGKPEAPSAAPAEQKPSEAKPADKKPADKKPADKKPADKKPAEKKPQPPAGAPAPGAATPPQAAESAEQNKPLPADISSWQDGDYLAAKQSRDPRLLDAVAYLGEQYSGDATAARILATILVTPEDPEPEPKPEPKVEKKPEKKPSSEYDEYGEGAPSDESMGEQPPMEEPSMESDMGYNREYSEDGQRKTALPPPPLAASYVSLTGGIIRALGANGTSEARQVLEQLLFGRIPIGNDRMAVGAVLRTLTDYPNPENELLLYRVLTAPEGFRPSAERLKATLAQAIAATAPAKPAVEAKQGAEGEGAGKPPKVDPAAEAAAAVEAALRNMVTAEDLQDTALPLVMNSASMGLRVELAKYLIGQPSQKIGPRLQELVTAANPLNVQAQVGLYRFANTPAEMRSRFEHQFTSYAADSLGRMMGVSTDQGADLATVAAPGAGMGQPAAPKKVWSGFGDDPTQTAEPPKPGGRADGGMTTEPGMEPMPEEYDSERRQDQARDEGMPPEGMPPEGMPPEGYQEGVPDGRGGPGGQPARTEWMPPKGPAEADKESAQKFTEVAATNPNLPYELARQFWNAPFVPAVAAKMEAMANLSDGPQLILLAGAIPTDAMRMQLYKTLQARWVDGPEPLSAATAYPATAIGDPGYLLIVKSLPRRMPPTRTRTDARVPPPTPEQQAQFGWMHVAYTTVMDYCNRFKLAAENQPANIAETVAGLPFKVHSQEGISHCYAMDWQQQVANRLAGAPIDPLKVYYVRFEEMGRYATVEGFYKRAVKLATERILQNGMWIEGMSAGSQPGRKVSMDVIIERPEFSPQRKPGEAEPLVTQILYIEINDPAGAAATASTTTP